MPQQPWLAYSQARCPRCILLTDDSDALSGPISINLFENYSIRDITTTILTPSLLGAPAAVQGRVRRDFSNGYQHTRMATQDNLRSPVGPCGLI